MHIIFQEFEWLFLITYRKIPCKEHISLSLWHAAARGNIFWKKHKCNYFKLLESLEYENMFTVAKKNCTLL